LDRYQKRASQRDEFFDFATAREIDAGGISGALVRRARPEVLTLPGLFLGRNGSESESEIKRRLAHRDYSADYSRWILGIEDLAENGTKAQRLAASEELAFLRDKNLLAPLPYEPDRAHRSRKDDDQESDPAEYAVDRTDPRIPIVDFDSVSVSELQKFCDHFRLALVFATKPRKGRHPDLMQMGVRMLTIFQVMFPKAKMGMDLRIPSNAENELRSALAGRDPLETGKFFRRPIMWVRKCTSLLQLGKRGYSMTYVLCGDLINSPTCAALGGLDNKSRQAANKPIQDFRDHFSGIKSLPMRGTTTRKRCKEAQEKN
jgi:hypothetical protein